MPQPQRERSNEIEGELFRLLVENVTDYAIFVVDPQGRVQSWNGGAERMLGYREEEIVGRSAHIFFTPEDVQRGIPELEMQQALTGGRGDDDRWHVRKDGSRFWSGGTMTPLWDEARQLRGFSKIMRDRTEWKRAEEARLSHAKETERRQRLYEAALSNTPDLVYVFDLQHRFAYANEGLLAMWGRSWDEAIGKNCLELGYEPWHAAMHDREIDQVVATKQPIKGEVPFTGAYGRRIYEYILVPVIGENGEVEAVAGTTRDVTDRRQAEEQVRHSEERFRSLMEQAPFSIQIFSPDGRTIRVNRAWEELWGVRFEQIDGYNILQDRQLEARGVLSYIQRGFAGQTTRIPAIQYDPNETIADITQQEAPSRWLSAVIYPIHGGDGKVREVVVIHEDITARKRAEEALRDSRERLDLALQAAELGQWELSLCDRRAFRNLRHDQIFGYDALQPEWTYDSFLTHVLPEYREIVDGSFRRAIESGEAWDFECRIQRADGEVRWIWARGRVCQDEVGQGSRMIGTVADITARKEIEMELRDARARLDAALEAGAIGTWTWDIPNNRLYTDENLARLFNLAPSEAAGGLLDKYIGAIHPDDWPRVSAALARSLENSPNYEADYRIVQADRSVRWVVARGRTERDASGRPVRMPGVLVDITERKRLEEELRVRIEQLAEADRSKEELLAMLRESEQKLRLLADTIPQLAWMARPDGHIFWYNRRWYDYTGMAPQEMQGWGWQKVHDREALPHVLARWKKSIASGEPFDMVFPLKGADQQFRPFLTRVNPLRDQEGRILYWFGTNTDISDIKRMEEALRDADRRKDEFLATLAHELRNPLAPIRNSLQILKMPRVDAETAQQTREMMERQVHHLVRLVDDLLDVSRVMRGKIELRREPVELASVVARAVETAQPLIEVQGHELDISLTSESLLLDADPVRLAQVFGNLLTNSAKYTEANGQIKLTAQREGDQAVLHVLDNGIGIAPDMLPHVFDLFVQVDQATSRAQGGLGIGLTLVKNLVEMHGGTVEAHRAGLGEGCEFVVRLPLLRQAGREVVPDDPSSQQVPAPSGSRLLVVDDNRDAATSLAMLLRLQGHDVRVAHDGPSALEMAASFRPQVVFLDLGMPGMDGYEVARRWRQIPDQEHTVLAALTGWGQQEDRRRTAEAGFDHHLVKPPEPKVVESLLAELKRRDD